MSNFWIYLLFNLLCSIFLSFLKSDLKALKLNATSFDKNLWQFIICIIYFFTCRLESWMVFHSKFIIWYFISWKFMEILNFWSLIICIFIFLEATSRILYLLHTHPLIFLCLWNLNTIFIILICVMTTINGFFYSH